MTHLRLFTRDAWQSRAQKGVQGPAVAQLAETHKHVWRHHGTLVYYAGPLDQGLFLSCLMLSCHRQGDGLLAGGMRLGNEAGSSV